MKVLFVCNQNQNRSLTAEHMFKSEFECKSAGLYNETPLTSNDLDWADLVVVMEDEQRTEIGERFPTLYMKKRIVSLDIADIYKYQDSRLIPLLREKVSLVIAYCSQS